MLRVSLFAALVLARCAAGAVPFKAARSPNGPALDATPHTFGFVCGVHFSGTSILHYALGRNPEVSIMHVAPKRMDEGQGFQDVMPTAAEVGREAVQLLGVDATQTKELGRYFALDKVRFTLTYIVAQLELRWLTAQQDAHLTESSALYTPKSAARLRSQWGKLWDTTRPVLVEKSPPDLIRMRFLAAVFPPAWFVVILRHPLSVCRRVEWHMRLLCTHNWLNAYEWASEDMAEGQLTAYVTYYEHWVNHPVQELRAMTPLLGLSDPDFDWSTVIRENSNMNLKSHASSGWGYSGPLTSAGIPDVSKEIHVDGSRPLPEAHQDISRYGNTTVRSYFEALEGRLNVFGYSFNAPFITDCDMELRRKMACAAARTFA